MSEEEQQTGAGEKPPVDLTSLEFGPAWARGDGGDKKREKQQQAWAAREEKHGGRRGGGGGRRDDRRGGGGPRGGGQRGGQRGGGQREDRRGRGGRDRRDDRGGRGKRGDGRHERRQREEVPAPEGITAQIMPVEEGLDSLAKEILAAGRTYAVFDLAKLVLGARERFNVGFQCAGDVKLYRCRKDGSVWMNKDEAVQGFWQGEWKKEFYEEVVQDAEPPKGNFQAVAKCGLSGEYLGPPNYHGYQMAVVEMHRERFAHMSLDNYKRKIQMVRDEDAVNAWLEKMSHRVRYRPTGGRPPEEAPAGEESAAEGKPVEEETPAAEEQAAAENTEAPVAEESTDEAAAPAEAPAEESAPDETPAEEPVAAEEPAEEDAPAEEAAAPQEAPPAAAAEPVEELLHDLRAVERHFLEHHFAEVFQHTAKAWVPGGVPGNHLSPGLLTLLRHTVAEERRYPGRLTPILCRQLSGRHVAVFKWRKKLKAGPARPHAIPKEIVLADRPRQLLVWLQDNSGKMLEDLWKDVLPEGSDDDVKHAWYHDLHWVLNQGYALLLADSSLHLAKTGPAAHEGATPEAAKAAAPEAKEKPETSPAAEGEDANPAAPSSEAAADQPVPQEVKEDESAPATEEAEPAVAPSEAAPPEQAAEAEAPVTDPTPVEGDAAPEESKPDRPEA